MISNITTESFMSHAADVPCIDNLMDFPNTSSPKMANNSRVAGNCVKNKERDFENCPFLGLGCECMTNSFGDVQMLGMSAIWQDDKDAVAKTCFASNDKQTSFGEEIEDDLFPDYDNEEKEYKECHHHKEMCWNVGALHHFLCNKKRDSIVIAFQHHNSS